MGVPCIPARGSAQVWPLSLRDVRVNGRAMKDVSELVNAVRALIDLGVTGLLAFALIGGSRKWWVFGWQYELLIAERDKWEAIATRGLGVAERAVKKQDG